MTHSLIPALLSMAPPSGGAGGDANPYSGLIMLAVMFVIFYFLLIRPQQKKLKEQQAMLDKLERGNEVVTSSGIHGKIAAISDTTVTLQVEPDNVRIKFSKSSVAAVTGSPSDETKKGA